MPDEVRSAATTLSRNAMSEQPRSDRLGEIDTLRCIAMTMVIAMHCRLLPFGWMGVWLFYGVSGFVVTHSLVESRRFGSAAEGMRAFFSRRAARILPLYLAYVLAAFAFSAALSGRWEWGKLASFLLFYNNFQASLSDGFFVAAPVGHLWTISVEMQFYVLFGVAFFVLDRRVLTGALTALLVLAPLARLLTGLYLASRETDVGRLSYQVYSFSFTQFDAFAMGALLALNVGRLRRDLAWRLLLAGVAAMAVYATVEVAVNVLVRGRHGLGALKDVISGVPFGDGRHVALYTAVDLLAVGVLAVTVTGAVPLWSRVARSRVLQAVGRVSYGGYVLHLGCLAVLWTWTGGEAGFGPTLSEKLLRGVVMFVPGLTATVLLASLSYRFFERPIIKAAARRLGRAADAARPPPPPIANAGFSASPAWRRSSS